MKNPLSLSVYSTACTSGNKRHLEAQQSAQTAQAWWHEQERVLPRQSECGPRRCCWEHFLSLMTPCLSGPDNLPVWSAPECTLGAPSSNSAEQTARVSACTAVERTRHIKDSHGRIQAWTFRLKLLKPSIFLPLHSAVALLKLLRDPQERATPLLLTSKPHPPITSNPKDSTSTS